MIVGSNRNTCKQLKWIYLSWISLKQECVSCKMENAQCTSVQNPSWVCKKMHISVDIRTYFCLATCLQHVTKYCTADGRATDINLRQARRRAIGAPPPRSFLQNRGKIVVFQVSPMTATLRLLDKTDVDFADPRPASDFAKRVKNFDDVLSNPPLSIKLSMNCDLACWVEASFDLSYILLI